LIEDGYTLCVGVTIDSRRRNGPGLNKFHEINEAQQGVIDI